MDEIMKSDSPAGSGEPAEELSVEQSFEKLESMVRMLESEDVTLEDERGRDFGGQFPHLPGRHEPA